MVSFYAPTRLSQTKASGPPNTPPRLPHVLRTESSQENGIRLDFYGSAVQGFVGSSRDQNGRYPGTAGRRVLFSLFLATTRLSPFGGPNANFLVFLALSTVGMAGSRRGVLAGATASVDSSHDQRRRLAQAQEGNDPHQHFQRR